MKKLVKRFDMNAQIETVAIKNMHFCQIIWSIKSDIKKLYALETLNFLLELFKKKKYPDN